MNTWIVVTNTMGYGEGDDRIKIWGGFVSEADARSWVAEVVSSWRFLQTVEVFQVFPYDQTTDGGDS